MTESGAVVNRGTEVRAIAAPNVRPLGDDFLIRSFNDRGERIEEFAIRDPRVTLAALAAPASSSADFDVVLPFAAGIRRIEILAGVLPLYSADLKAALQGFCSAHVELDECIRLNSLTAIRPTRFDQVAADVAITRQMGDDIVIDETPGAPHSPGDGASDVQGNVVVAWAGADPPRIGFAVFVKGLAADGTVVLQKQRVDLAPQDDRSLLGCPAVARTRQGDFAVAWVIDDQPGAFTARPKVKARLFAADGSPRTGEIVLSASSPVAGIERSCPDVGMDSQGRVVVVWTEGRSLQGSRPRKLVARRLSGSGAFDGGEFQVPGDDATDRSDLFPAVAVEPGGGFVVSWTEPTSFQSQNFTSVFTQRYGASKQRLGAPLEIEALPGSVGASHPHALAMFGRASGPGDFLVTWQASQAAVKARLVDFQTGQPRSDAFVVNARPAGAVSNPANPAVGQGLAGRWFAAWTEAPNASKSGITAQVFDAEGGPLDIDFSVADGPSEQVLLDRATVVASGDRFLVMWPQQRGRRGAGQLIGRFYDGKPYPCPDSCGDAIPLLRTGPPETKADIIVFRREPLPIANIGTGPEFGRFVVSRIVNGWFNVDLIGANRRKFNMYYVPNAIPDRLTKREPAAEVGVLVANSNFGGVCSGNTNVEIHAGPDATIFAHEVGHCLFGLADERGCGQSATIKDTVRSEAPRHPNIFGTEARCQALSERPSACRSIPNTRAPACDGDVEGDGWWVSDAPDLMDGGTDFGADCRKNIGLFFQQLR